MKKLTILLLLVTTISYAQETITSELGTFDEIKVFNGLSVTLIKAETASIEIRGKKSQDVNYKNVNGRLKLSMRFPETFNSDDAKVTVYYANDIHLIDVNEGAHIKSSEVFKQQSIELKSQEGAFINLTVDVKYLTVKSVTGGNITVDGSATNQDIDATSGGSYNAFDLETDATTAISSTGAFIQVKAKDVLDITVRLGGSAYYKGNPIDLKTDKVLGGTIKAKN